MPRIFNAFDVGVICNRESIFGRFCFPQKAYEMLACGIPVVAADVGSMTELFADHKEFLYTPGKHQILAQTLRKSLQSSTTVPIIKIPTWADLAENIASLFKKIIFEKS